MIGWIPRILVGFLDEVGGIETRRAILADAGLDPEATCFRLDTDVPDPACRRVVEAACTRLGVTEAQAFALFAPHFLAAARATFPGRGVRVQYNSPNRLAALYVAVTHELARGFGERAEVRFEAGGPEDARCAMPVELAPADADRADAPSEPATALA